jgi:hypothetical protein
MDNNQDLGSEINIRDQACKPHRWSSATRLSPPPPRRPLFPLVTHCGPGSRGARRRIELGIYLPVLRIHDILVQIRIRGSMPLTNGSGSWILQFSSLAFKMPKKNRFLFCFSAYFFLKVHLHHFSKIKSQKEVTKQ